MEEYIFPQNEELKPQDFLSFVSNITEYNIRKICYDEYVSLPNLEERAGNLQIDSNIQNLDILAKQIYFIQGFGNHVHRMDISNNILPIGGLEYYNSQPNYQIHINNFKPLWRLNESITPIEAIISLINTYGVTKRFSEKRSDPAHYYDENIEGDTRAEGLFFVYSFFEYVYKNNGYKFPHSLQNYFRRYPLSERFFFETYNSKYKSISIANYACDNLLQSDPMERVAFKDDIVNPSVSIHKAPFPPFSKN